MLLELPEIAVNQSFSPRKAAARSGGLPLKSLGLALALLLAPPALAQEPPAQMRFEVSFSKQLAVYEFLQNLFAKAGPNPFQDAFAASEFNTGRYTGLVAALESVPLDYEYDFPQYPPGAKIGGSTDYALKRNLIQSASWDEFRSRSIGLIPLHDLNLLASTLQQLEPVYDQLIYQPARPGFEKQLREIEALIASKDMGRYFEQARRFYRSSWDPTLPFLFVFYPLPVSQGFSATAFGNVSESALPTVFTEYTILLSVMLHEASHILFDEETLEFKQELDGWFTASPSRYRNFARGLMNESWATAVANGYFAEKLTGKLNPGSWYNRKYNDQMAKQIYPMLKEYLDAGKPLDKDLVDRYIAVYETRFAGWASEWDNLMSGRYVISENPADFELLDRKFRYRHVSEYYHDFSESSLAKLHEARATKLVVVAGDNERKLGLVKAHFAELGSWQPDAHQDFTYALLLSDGSPLIIVNLVASSLEKQLESKLEMH